MPKYNFNLRNGTAEGATPVNFIIRWNNRRLVYPSGECIPPIHWCSAKDQRNHQRAKQTKAFPEYPEFNERLEALLSTAKATFRQFALQNGRDPEMDELKAALDLATGRTQTRRVDLLSFAAAYIESEEGHFNNERKTLFHKATRSRFRVTLELLHDYVAQKDQRSNARPVQFNSIDPEFVAGFSVFLTKSKGFAANTVVKYGRTLRLFLRRAKEAGHEVNDQVFSKRLALKEEPSDQIYLTDADLDAFYKLNLAAQPRLERARDLFIVGAWTGLRFGDLSRVRPEHIEGDRLRVTTSKTGKQVVLPLHPCVRAIMAKYDGQIPSGISNQKQNDYLKEAAAQVPALQARVMIGGTVAGIRNEVSRFKWEMVTTHTARRSFASNLYRKGIPARTIMQVTGHTTEQAFMRYIRLNSEEHMDIIAASDLFQPNGMLKAV